MGTWTYVYVGSWRLQEQTLVGFGEGTVGSGRRKVCGGGAHMSASRSPLPGWTGQTRSPNYSYVKLNLSTKNLKSRNSGSEDLHSVHIQILIVTAPSPLQILTMSRSGVWQTLIVHGGFSHTPLLASNHTTFFSTGVGSIRPSLIS